MKPATTLAKLGAAAVITTLVVIAWGGVVRATGSGLGCPDWPRCHGAWIPPLERTALIEYTHRSLAAILGLMVVALVVLAWGTRRDDRRAWLLALSALVLVIFQAWLGREVVVSELSPLMVSVHLGTAMGLLAVLLLVALPEARSVANGERAIRLWVATAGMLGVIVVGALVRAEAAGLAFADWPLMDGALVPTGLSEGFRLVHFLHRSAALLVGLYLVYLYVHLRGAPARALPRTMAGLVLTLYVFQALIGATAVWTMLDAWTVVAHVGVATLTWAVAFLLPFAGSMALTSQERSITVTAD